MGLLKLLIKLVFIAVYFFIVFILVANPYYLTAAILIGPIAVKPIKWLVVKGISFTHESLNEL